MIIYFISFSCSVYEIQTQIFFGLDDNMKKSMIITIYCVFGCQIASYELNTPVYDNTVPGLVHKSTVPGTGEVPTML